MNAVKPFGQLESAIILVIGHDPRLQRSDAEAEFAFFMDYLTRPKPASRPEQRKYELAEAIVAYVSDLAGQSVPLDQLYVTNLCNEFLPHTPGSGTVLIPDDVAEKGVQEIVRTVATGNFQLILPMAVQPCYHLCRLGFMDEDTEVVRRFVEGARPRASNAALGIYEPSGRAPFLSICGQTLHHRGVPVIPIVHVKQWHYLPTRSNLVKYRPLMANAQIEVQSGVG